MWDTVLDVIKDSLIDSLKMLPFLLLCFALLEYLEYRAGDKTAQKLKATKKAGPVLGALFGVLPQCGFSVVASSLYSGNAITLGALIAVFLSTSDEALVVMLSAPAFIPDILKVILIKIVLGIALGYAIDLILSHRIVSITQDTHIVHTHDKGCHCESEHEHGGRFGFIKGVLHHTFSVWAFILGISLGLGLVIELAGTEALERVLLSNTMWQPLMASIVGLIPNCAASVLLAELYMGGVLSFPSLAAGLSAATGLGLLTLFRVNRPMKNNFIILLLVLAVSLATGYISMLFV